MSRPDHSMMPNVINSLPGIVFWKSRELRYLGANAEFLRFAGLSDMKQLIGKRDDELPCSLEHQQYFGKFDRKVIESEQAKLSIQASFRLPTGKTVILVADKYPLYDDNRQVTGVLCHITTKKIDSTTQTYLENIIASVPYYIFWKDTDSIYLGCNQKFASLVGKTPPEIIGKSDLELGWKSDEEAHLFISGDKAAMSGEPKVDVEETVLQPDGSMRVMLLSKVPVFDKKQVCIGVLGVSVDITERKNLEANLKKALTAAEAANLAKTEFIANMSHDIRTPLSGVVGMSKIMEEHTNDPREKQYAHWINDCGQQLLALLNGILDVVSADNVGEDNIVDETFDLLQCIEDIAELELPTVKMRGLDLQVEIDESVPRYLTTDRTKLHRIILNLLGNAIKFTRKGHVGIGIELLDNQGDFVRLRFKIFDTGVGIPDEFQSKVFDRFYRADPSWKGVYQGHGIGLHIAQSYAELLGGEIKLISKVNEGTTFYFDLEMKVGQATDSQSDFVANETDLNMTGVSDIPSSSVKAQNDVQVAAIADADKPYLLLVEDNIIALRTIEISCTKAGCRYESAVDAESALELVKTREFDLIITDLGLPGMSGAELTALIRDWERSHNLKQVPIAGLTAHSGKAEIERLLKAGMNKVLIKPASYEVIKGMIDELVTENKAYNLSSPECKKSASMENKQLPEKEEQLFDLLSFPLLDIEKGLQGLGSEAVLRELLMLMHDEELPQDEQVMKQAYRDNNWDIIEKTAHKMKGGAVYCGTVRLKFACQYLERYRKAGHKQLLEQLYHQLVQTMADTKQSIDDWLRK